MNSDDLKFFSLVVASGSISSAALASGCDASTISRRITQLEKSVGARLFSRSGRGVTLTQQGQELLHYAHQVTSLIEAAQAAMSSTGRHPAHAAEHARGHRRRCAVGPGRGPRAALSQVMLVEGSGVRVLVDHCGRSEANEGLQQPGFRALLDLARSGRVAVKLSGASGSRQPNVAAHEAMDSSVPRPSRASHA